MKLNVTTLAKHSNIDLKPLFSSLEKMCKI